MPYLSFSDKPRMRNGSMLSVNVNYRNSKFNSSLDQQSHIRNRMTDTYGDRIIHITFPNPSYDEYNGSWNWKAKYLEYVRGVLEEGVQIEDKVYLFCGHSNSQLKSRGCFLIEANDHSFIQEMINTLGDFSEIQSVGRMSKRIGQLFSGYGHACEIDDEDVAEILDVERNGKIFTDGCGLIDQEFGLQIKQDMNKREIFNRKLPVGYIPSVFQVRYKGYKGVLTSACSDEILRVLNTIQSPKGTKAGFVSKALDWIWRMVTINSETIPEKLTPKVIFRNSMLKFEGCPMEKLCILDHSRPSDSAKLNGELVSILSSLGVPDAIFQQKQIEYFRFIRNALKKLPDAFDFLEYMERFDLVKKLKESQNIVNMDTVPDWIKKQITWLQKNELQNTFDKYDLQKVHIVIPKSRLLFGVCDISGKLKEGQCFVKITVDRKDFTTKVLTGAVIVGRNPCLHPGDIQKFVAVNTIPELYHLQDCIVFSTKGKLPPASQMSGGDLDGDKFFVSWDKDIFPPNFDKALDYSDLQPDPQSSLTRSIRQSDMIDYFVNYKTSLGEIMTLYWGWIRANSDERAHSKECIELNELYSKCVDGGKVVIPKKLKIIPKADISRRFILDILRENSTNFIDGKFDLCLGWGAYFGAGAAKVIWRNVSSSFNRCRRQNRGSRFLPY